MLERADKLFHESLEMERQQDDEEGQALALLNLGLVALKRGSAHTARPLLVEGLGRSYRLGHSDFIVSSLETLAAVAASQRDPEMAAELLGEPCRWLRLPVIPQDEPPLLSISDSWRFSRMTP